MGVNASRFAGTFDADTSVQLKASGAVTSTTTETAIDLKQLDDAYWQDGNEIPYGVFEVWVEVTAFDATTGDETYTFSLVIDDTSALSDSPVTLFSVLLPGATGVYKFLLDSKTLPRLNSDHSGTSQWLAAKMTVAGTTPTITYAAWLGKSIHA